LITEADTYSIGKVSTVPALLHHLLVKCSVEARVSALSGVLDKDVMNAIEQAAEERVVPLFLEVGGSGPGVESGSMCQLL
jgi:hypothetical protein